MMACPRIRHRAAGWLAPLLLLTAGLIGPAAARPPGAAPDAAAPPASAPAPFPPGDVSSDYAGVRVADPYRALEDTAAPAVKAWVDAQATWTRRQLDALPGRAALLRHIEAVDKRRAPAVGSVQQSRSGALFYLKRVPGGRSFKLYSRASARAPERLLLDPEAWERQTGQPHAINNFSVAPDGRHVAAVVSVADAELGELRLLDVATGRPVRPPVPAIWGELAATWLPDSRSVIYAQGGDALKPGGQPFGKMQLRQRTLADGPDRLLYGHGQAMGPEVRATDWVYLDATSSDEYLVSFHFEGVVSDLRAYAVRREDLLKDPATAAWTPVIAQADQVREAVVHGRYLDARSYQGAPRYRVLRYDLARLEQAPQEVVPQQDGVIDGLAAAADGLYLLEWRGATNRLLRLPQGAAPGAVQTVALPAVGAVSLLDAQPRQAGVVFSLSSWTHSPRLLRTRDLRVQDAGLVPPDRSPVGRDWVSEESTCTSHDGAEVPMSLIYRRGLVRDGRRPVIVDGYGGYGLQEPAYFNPRLDAWLQRGGIWVDVKPRGGGAKGRDWYQDGVGPRKSNTWLDMIACAQAVIESGYTRPAQLAILGTSMGGVAVGRAITDRPELFAAAVVRVGITDAVRFIEATTNGPNHALEMGRVDTEAGIRQLLAMSTYHQIRDGVAYPATLFTTGVNDNRVAPWLAYKTFARLAAASSSGKPVMLRVEQAGGHGVGSTATQRNRELADVMAFVLQAFGDPAFQPRR